MQPASHSDMMFDVCERLVLPFVLYWIAFHVGMKNCPVYYIYIYTFFFFSSKNITQRVTH